jgi:hypothetical protein
VEGAGREAAALEKGVEVERRLRHVGGVLEQAGVARHERRGRESDHLPERVVPRHDREHDTDRRVAGAGGGGVHRRRIGERLRRQELLGVIGVVTHPFRALEHLGAGSGDRTAHLDGDDACDPVDIVFEQLRGSLHPLGALREGGRSQGSERRVGCRDPALDLGFVMRFERLLGLARERVDRRDGHAGSSSAEDVTGRAYGASVARSEDESASFVGFIPASLRWEV